MCSEWRKLNVTRCPEVCQFVFIKFYTMQHVLLLLRKWIVGYMMKGNCFRVRVILLDLTESSCRIDIGTIPIALLRWMNPEPYIRFCIWTICTDRHDVPTQEKIVTPGDRTGFNQEAGILSTHLSICTPVAGLWCVISCVDIILNFPIYLGLLTFFNLVSPWRILKHVETSCPGYDHCRHIRKTYKLFRPE